MWNRKPAKWRVLSMLMMVKVVVVVMVVVQATAMSSTLLLTSLQRADDSGREGEAGGNALPLNSGTPSPSRALRLRQVRKRDVDQDVKAFASEYLHNFGFDRKRKPLPGFPETLPEGSDFSQSQDKLASAIPLFQSYFGLEQTGQLDAATLRLMRKDRCGVPDIPEGSPQVKVRSNGLLPFAYEVFDTKWTKHNLTWKVNASSTQQVTPERLRQIIQQALEEWGRVAPLDFEERLSGKVDIDIKFGTREHGDRIPFDGPGQILAHAYQPGNRTINGDIHVDDDEDWTPAEEDGGHRPDLYLVFVHEIGHALGLKHSNDPGAIMYPFFSATEISDDDVKGIQFLYGIRERPRPTPTPTPPSTIRPTDAPTRPTIEDRRPWNCNVTFDVVLQGARRRGVYRGISGDQIFEFTSEGILSGSPYSLDSVFPYAPPFADAVFSTTDHTYFVHNNKVWRYTESQLDPDYPKNLNPTHFPEGLRFGIAIPDSHGHYYRTLVFGSSLWWGYNFDDVSSGDDSRPRPNLIAQFWPLVTRDVHCAILGPDHNIYLLTPDSHSVMDRFRRPLQGKRRLKGYPQWLTPACQLVKAPHPTGAANRNVNPVWSVGFLNLLLPPLLLTK